MSGLKWVLFIDGNDNERAYYADRLRSSSADYEIFEAVSGAAGLEICKSHPIDCVVLEIDLPDISGFQVLLKLVPVARHPDIAVIVLTRVSNRHVLDLARKNGAQAVLTKFGASGDVLDRALFKAMAAVQAERKRA